MTNSALFQPTSSDLKAFVVISFGESQGKAPGIVKVLEVQSHFCCYCAVFDVARQNVT